MGWEKLRENKRRKGKRKTENEQMKRGEKKKKVKKNSISKRSKKGLGQIERKRRAQPAKVGKTGGGEKGQIRCLYNAMQCSAKS